MGADVVAVRREHTALESDLEGVPVRTSLDEIPMRDPTIAIICTPTARHVPDALAAASRGFHVLVEKPLGDSLDGTRKLVETLAANGRIGGVAYCLRFHPVIRELRERLERTPLGAPLYAAVWCGSDLASWRPGRPVRDTYSAHEDLGGGVVLDLSHELDYLTLLLGPAVSLRAQIERRGSLEIETEDTADIVLDLASGARATCHLDYLARPPVRGGILIGSEGALRWDLLTPSLELKTLDTGPEWRSTALTAPWTWGQMYIDELASFEAAARAGAEWEGGIESGIRVLSVALAARKSGADGARVTVGT